MRHFGAISAMILASGLVAISGAQSADRPILEKELAERLRFYQSIKTLEVEFSQVKTLREMKLKLRSKGELLLRRPGRFVWKITEPSPVSVSLEGEELKMVSGKGKDAQTQVLKLRDMPTDQAMRSMTAMVAWLNMDAHSLSQEYRVLETAKSRYRFEPLQKKTSPFADLELTLSTEGHLRELVIHELSGDQLEILFSKPRSTSK